MKKIIPMLGVLSLLTFTLPALADTTTPSTTVTAPNPSAAPKVKMTVNINPSGEALLTGTVKSTGTNVLTVTSWGGDWIVNVSDKTKFTGQSNLASVKVGDMITVHGSANTTTPWTVDATTITPAPVKKTEEMKKKEAEKPEIKQKTGDNGKNKGQEKKPENPSKQAKVKGKG